MDRVVVPALRAAGVDPDDVAIVHCPERVIPGAIVKELRENDRVVGGRKPGDAERARDLYASFCDGEIVTTSNVTAELTKVVENTYRDVNIAFSNELALLSEELGVDAHEVIALANRHPRVNILSPGPGVGGHCIPVDPHFLSNANPFVTELIQTARRINERMPHVVVRRVAEVAPAVDGARIAILGAAYKANVDDTRESPTERVEDLLRERGYETRVFDPLADRYVRPLAASLEDAVAGCDAIVLMVGHDAFASIDPAAVAPLCRGKQLVDTRAFFDAGAWAAAGFGVYTLGGARRVPLPEPASPLRVVNPVAGALRRIDVSDRKVQAGLAIGALVLVGLWLALGIGNDEYDRIAIVFGAPRRAVRDRAGAAAADPVPLRPVRHLHPVRQHALARVGGHADEVPRAARVRARSPCTSCARAGSSNRAARSTCSARSGCSPSSA